MLDAAHCLENARRWHEMGDQMRGKYKDRFERREQMMYYHLLLWAEADWRPDFGSLPYGFVCHGVTDGGAY